MNIALTAGHSFCFVVASMSWRALTGLAAALVVGGCAAPSVEQGEGSDTDGDGLHELSGGVDATETDYPTTINVSDCSGAKVAPNKILTAAHCIMTFGKKVFSPRLNGQQVWVSSAPKPLNADSSKIVSKDPTKGFLPVRITGVYLEDSWVAAKPFPDVIDVAVLVVADEDVPKIASIPTASVDFSAVDVGTPVALTGYGCDSAGNVSTTPNHRRYQKTRTVVGDKNAPRFLFTAWQATDSTSADTCQGDSGGPLYRLDGTGAPAGIVGVNALSGNGLNYASRLTDTTVGQAIRDGAPASMLRAMDAFGTTCVGGTGTVIGAIKDKYLALGACKSDVGIPRSDEGTAQRNGRYTHFSNGSIYWTAQNGAFAVVGEIRDAWGATGWEGGPLGFPISDTMKTSDGGSYVTFEKGTMYDSLRTEPHAVYGKILEKWREIGAEASDLGYPIKDEYAVDEGRRSDFEHGTITWNGSEAVVYVQGR